MLEDRGAGWVVKDIKTSHSRWLHRSVEGPGQNVGSMGLNCLDIKALLDAYDPALLQLRFESSTKRETLLFPSDSACSTARSTICPRFSQVFPGFLQTLSMTLSFRRCRWITLGTGLGEAFGVVRLSKRQHCDVSAQFLSCTRISCAAKSTLPNQQLSLGCMVPPKLDHALYSITTRLRRGDPTHQWPPSLQHYSHYLTLLLTVALREADYLTKSETPPGPPHFCYMSICCPIPIMPSIPPSQNLSPKWDDVLSCSSERYPVRRPIGATEPDG